MMYSKLLLLVLLASGAFKESTGLPTIKVKSARDNNGAQVVGKAKDATTSTTKRDWLAPFTPSDPVPSSNLLAGVMVVCDNLWKILLETYFLPLLSISFLASIAEQVVPEATAQMLSSKVKLVLCSLSELAGAPNIQFWRLARAAIPFLDSLLSSLPAFCTTALVVPFVEELVYRKGFAMMLRSSPEHSRRPSAFLWISSVCYGLCQFGHLNIRDEILVFDAPESLGVGIVKSVLTFLMAYRVVGPIYLKHDLWGSFAAHASWDFLMFGTMKVLLRFS